jgi:hypothetical protein
MVFNAPFSNISDISWRPVLLAEETGVTFNANFNNISAISWQLVLLMEEIGVPGENHHPAASH